MRVAITYYSEEVRHSHVHYTLMNIPRTKKPSIQQSEILLSSVAVNCPGMILG